MVLIVNKLLMTLSIVSLKRGIKKGLHASSPKNNKIITDDFCILLNCVVINRVRNLFLKSPVP